SHHNGHQLSYRGREVDARPAAAAPITHPRSRFTLYSLLKIGVAVDVAFVFSDEGVGFLFAEESTGDACSCHTLKIIPRLAAVVARQRDHIGDAAALHDARDVVAPIRIYYNVGLVGLAEKIMVAAHHFLVGTNQEDRDVVRLAGERV